MQKSPHGRYSGGPVCFGCPGISACPLDGNFPRAPLVLGSAPQCRPQPSGRNGRDPGVMGPNHTILRKSIGIGAVCRLPCLAGSSLSTQPRVQAVCLCRRGAASKLSRGQNRRIRHMARSGNDIGHWCTFGYDSAELHPPRQTVEPEPGRLSAIGKENQND